MVLKYLSNHFSLVFLNPPLLLYYLHRFVQNTVLCASVHTRIHVHPALFHPLAGILRDNVIYHYDCLGKIVADKVELNDNEATEFFERLGVKFSFTTSNSLEANEKIECERGP